MSDEKPVSLKRQLPKQHKLAADSSSGNRTCVVHNPHLTQRNTGVHKFTDTSWTRVQDIAIQRSERESASDRQDTICSQIPNQLINSKHGYHRSCYQSFTNTKYLRKRTVDSLKSDLSESGTSEPKRRRKVSTETTSQVLFPENQCIICEKSVVWLPASIRKPRSKDLLVKCVTKTAETSIKEVAQEKSLTRLIGLSLGVDLIAREAHYHESCRKALTRKPKKQAYAAAEPGYLEMESQAHQAAFDCIIQYVDKSIIQNSQVERMTMLKERYCAFMQLNYPAFYNSQYKTDKLKNKLIKYYGVRIQFWQPNYRSDLVYSTDILTGQAVEAAFEVAASDEKRLEEAALLIRRTIIDGFKNSPELPWPPSSDYLLSSTISPPLLITNFIARILTHKGDISSPSSRCMRLTQSISQDICYAVTRGQWKMPKQLLLGMDVRHLTNSAEVITMLNRFGHTVSHSTLLELETAMCNSVIQNDSIVPSTISKEGNVVTHLCWDNFDLNEETPSGHGTTHSTHGIIIQEVQQDRNELSVQICQERTKERSVKYIPDSLGPCYVRQKVEPGNHIISTTSDPSLLFNEQALQSDFMWMLSRKVVGEIEQIVPHFNGWISLTGSSLDEEHKQSVVDYMPPICFPVTDNATVQEVLRISQQASREVGQQYTILTFDLAVAKKAYAIIWQYPDLYKDTIVRLGVFHTICSYLGALGKLLRGSGFEEIVIDSGICAGGSIEKVMMGRHYNRAMRVHKIMLEALERLLFDQFEKFSKEDITDAKNSMETMAANLNYESFTDTVLKESVKVCYAEYTKFKEMVRQGKFGKTAQFWIHYMDRVWTVLRFLRATKLNNFKLHVSCLPELCPLLFTMNHHNYARYLSFYYVSLLNLSETHPGAEELFEIKGFSVSRSPMRSSRNPVDLTIEQTMNRHAKSSGGIIGFSRNIAAYYRWCVTRHLRASYVSAALELAGMITAEESTHKDLRKSEISKGERDVQKVLTSVGNFIDPFDVCEHDNLICLSSGLKAPEPIATSLLSINYLGNTAFQEFMNTRLIEKTVPFHAPLKRMSIKTFTDLQKHSKMKSSSKKIVQVTSQRNLLGQLLMLSENNSLDMQKVLSYPLGPVPWALATPDGILSKTNKATLLHKLEDDASLACLKQDSESLKERVYVIDGNALFHSLTHLPDTFGGLALQLFSALPKSNRVDFVTDSYKKNSIKEAERVRRGISPSYLVKGSSTKLPRDWKLFLSNDSNKTNLIDFILSEWQTDTYAERLFGREVLYVSAESCYLLTSTDGKTTLSTGVSELSSIQEEADTRLILHCLHAASSSRCGDIVVRSPDTDVFILLLHYGEQITQDVFFETGTGNKRRIIDIHCLINIHGDQLCQALPGLHSFTGCDTTSAFVGKGKVKPLKLLKKHEEYLDLMSALGKSETVPDDISESLETFVCCLYGKSTYSDINKLRYDMARQKYKTERGIVLSNYDGIDMSLLPPCRATLKQHILRANYQALLWKSAHLTYPGNPEPENHGWKLNRENQLVCNWCDEDVMPQELVDILSQEEEDGAGLASDDEDNGEGIVHVSLADEIYYSGDEDSDNELRPSDEVINY